MSAADPPSAQPPAGGGAKPAPQSPTALATTLTRLPPVQRSGKETLQGLPAPEDAGPQREQVDGELPRVPGYEILAELGHGGMGVVYKARQIQPPRTVALKMILAGVRPSDEQLARFRTEAEAVARLQHTGIVQIFEVGEHHRLPYFSLEFVEGGSLESKLRGMPLPPGPAARLIVLLAQAIQAAHDKEILHRDLKPANVLLLPSKETGAIPIGLDDEKNLARFLPKITDFGLAKRLDVEAAPGAADLTQTGAVMGTPSFMAPEQAAGRTREIGKTTDVYALGAILYTLLTGRPPFRTATTLDTLLQVIHDEPAPPRELNKATPRDLETICLKCLQKEPEKRYISAQALSDDLERFLEGQPILARPASRRERVLKWVKRRPAVAALAALGPLLVLAAAVAAISLALWADADKRRRQQHADTIVGLRQAAELDESQALGQAQAGRFKVAHEMARKASGRLAEVPELDELRARLDALRNRMDRLAVFYGNMDDAERIAIEATRYGGQDTEARAAAKRALASLEIFEQARWWEQLPDDDLRPAQRDRLREDVHELILLLAGLQLIDGGKHLFTAEGEAALQESRKTVQAARRYRVSQTAYAVTVACRLGLAEAAPPDAEADPGPVGATDHYFSGIVHFWIAHTEIQPSPLTRMVMLLLRTVRTKILDFKTPLATAQEKLMTASRLDPNHYWTHYWLARTFQQADNFREAELACNTCLALRPDYAAGYATRGDTIIEQALLAGDQRRKDDLVRRGFADLDEAVRREPQSYMYHDRGACFIRLADRTADQETKRAWLVRAIADMTEAIRLDPDHPKPLAGRAACRFRLQEFDGAIEDYTESIRLDQMHPERDPAVDFFWRGQAFQKKGELDRSIADYTEAIRRDPKTTRYYIQRGLAHHLKGDYELAVSDATEAIKLDPNHALARANRGQACLMLGKHERAIADLTEAVKLDPENASIRAALEAAKIRGGAPPKPQEAGK
jgi:tetratricopeptide (TPR) repeat protein